MAEFVELTGDQRRAVVNTRQLWEAWQSSFKRRVGYSGSMVWRTPQRGGEYLYRLTDDAIRGGRREKSLGLRSATTEQIFDDFHTNREAAKDEFVKINARLQQQARLNKALDLGRVPTTAAKVLRLLHRENLLGHGLIVTGTNSIYAYEAAAGVHVATSMLATDDLDILFDARRRLKLTMDRDEPRLLIDVLKSADKSFRIFDNAPYRAMNSEGYLVELIKPEPKSLLDDEPDGMGPGDLQATHISNMKWIENAPKFSSVAIGDDGLPAPIVCVDPRAFALYKYNMGTADQTRDSVKRARDVAQSETVASIVQENLPQLPFEPDHMKFLPKVMIDSGGEHFRDFFHPNENSH